MASERSGSGRDGRARSIQRPRQCSPQPSPAFVPGQGSWRTRAPSLDAREAEQKAASSPYFCFRHFRGDGRFRRDAARYRIARAERQYADRWVVLLGSCLRDRPPGLGRLLAWRTLRSAPALWLAAAEVAIVGRGRFGCVEVGMSGSLLRWLAGLCWCPVTVTGCARSARPRGRIHLGSLRRARPGVRAELRGL